MYNLLRNLIREEIKKLMKDDAIFRRHELPGLEHFKDVPGIEPERALPGDEDVCPLCRRFHHEDECSLSSLS